MKIHMVPIGGTAMVPLAALLAEQGHSITGTDLEVYPPMSTLLASLGIPVQKGYAAEHVPAGCGRGSSSATPPCGTTSRPRRRSGEGCLSSRMPQAIGVPAARKDLARRHGHARKDDDFGADGLAALDSVATRVSRRGRDAQLRPRLPARRRAAFVLEGDEYNAAFFDRGPKFLHYEPKHLFVGNIEFDHADLYPDLDAIEDAFRQVVRSSPATGA